MKKTIKEISEIYNVTPMGVRYWISKGLPFTTEKVIGVKKRKVIDLKDVEKFLKDQNN